MKNNGNSTRIVDRCIQELFTKGFTFLYDGRGDHSQTEETFGVFLNRLKTEHPNAKYVYNSVTESGIDCIKIEQHNL